MNGSSKYKLFLAYDGTRYSGWQEQPNSTSIQILVEKSLSTALRNTTKVVGAGRTDAGVHAQEQVAHFVTEQQFDHNRLLRSLNGLLPLDIRVSAIENADPNFHARYSACRKIYRYHVDCRKVANPFSRAYANHLPYPINRELLKQAAAHFIGTHDFTSFSNDAHRGSAAKNPIKTIDRLDIHVEETVLTLEFEGNGFLYKMVRNIVGTLFDIARGKIPIEMLPHIFEAKNRSKAGSCAPPHGLFLVKVVYEN